jgi:hypothetical protein
MPFNVFEFRSQLQGDGARPNLFEVQMVFPTAINPQKAKRKLERQPKYGTNHAYYIDFIRITCGS